MFRLNAGGKPSTRLPPGGLVELLATTSSVHNFRFHVFILLRTQVPKIELSLHDFLEYSSPEALSLTDQFEIG